MAAPPPKNNNQNRNASYWRNRFFNSLGGNAAPAAWSNYQPQSQTGNVQPAPTSSPVPVIGIGIGIVVGLGFLLWHFGPELLGKAKRK